MITLSSVRPNVSIINNFLSTSTTSAASANTARLLNDALATKLDTSAYVQHYRGKYASLIALQTAIPTGNDGDYAVIDTGIANNATFYIWDAQDGWVSGGNVSGTTTDDIIEGSINLYYSDTLVRAALLTGLSLVSGTIISSSDNVLSSLGKLQKQITDTNTLLTNYLTTADASTTYATIANQRYTFVSDASATYTVPASAVTENGRTIIDLSNSSLTSITVDSSTGTGKVAGDSVHISITGTYAAQALVASGVTLQGDLTFSYQHQTKTLIYKGSNVWKVVG